MKSLESLYRISFNSTAKKFLNIIKDLDIRVYDVIIIVYIFVIEVVNLKYLIILGNFYLISTRVEVTRDNEGNYFIILRD